MTSEEMKAFAEMLAKAIKDDTEDKKTKRETISKDDTPEVKAQKQLRNRQKDLSEARSNKAANERLRLETQLNLSLNLVFF